MLVDDRGRGAAPTGGVEEAGIHLISLFPLSDLIGKNLIDVSSMPDIVDFNGAGFFIYAVNDPVALGSKRQVTCQFALKPLSRVGLLSRPLDRFLDERLERRRESEDLPAAGRRVDEPLIACHGGAQAFSWVITLPV